MCCRRGAVPLASKIHTAHRLRGSQVHPHWPEAKEGLTSKCQVKRKLSISCCSLLKGNHGKACAERVYWPIRMQCFSMGFLFVQPTEGISQFCTCQIAAECLRKVSSFKSKVKCRIVQTNTNHRFREYRADALAAKATLPFLCVKNILHDYMTAIRKYRRHR